MKTIKFSVITLFLACVPLFFASCDKIKDLTTIEVELGKVSFDIPLEFDAKQSSSLLKSVNAEFARFSGQSEPLNLQSDMFEELSEYSGSSIVFLVSEVKLKITTTGESGTIVKDFSSITTGADKDLNYTKEGTIDLETEYSDAALTTYIKDVFSAIQDNKTIVVNVEGKTDIVPSGINGAEVTVITIIPTLKAKIKLL